MLGYVAGTEEGAAVKIKTSELIGTALDWAVAKAEGWAVMTRQAPERVLLANGDDWELLCMPSTDWSQGGPIIEREKIELKYLGYDNPPYWGALKFSPSKYARKAAIGLTPLIAAMRCVVASKLGDEVDVPEELLK